MMADRDLGPSFVLADTPDPEAMRAAPPADLSSALPRWVDSLSPGKSASPSEGSSSTA